MTALEELSLSFLCTFLIFRDAGKHVQYVVCGLSAANARKWILYVNQYLTTAVGPSVAMVTGQHTATVAWQVTPSAELHCLWRNDL